MKIAALILGILAGLSGLVVAAFASALISLASFGGLDSGAVALMRIIVFALPVASFVAAGLSMQRTRAALWIFAGVSAVWLLIGLQMGSPVNFVNATPLLFGVAAAALCYFAEFPTAATSVPAPASPRAAAQTTPPPRRTAPQFRTSRAIPDAEKWNALVRFDEDIRASADRLAPFGQRWVDELAAAYMAIGDKSYLPKIETRLRAEAEEEKVRLDAEAEATRERTAKQAEEDRIRAEQLSREAERIRAEKMVRNEARRKAFDARVSKLQSSAALSFERLRQNPLPVAIAVAALLLFAGAYAGYSGGYFDRLLLRDTPVAQAPSPATEQKPAPQSGPEQSKSAPQTPPEKPAAVTEQRGWLGIAMRQVNAEIAENLRLPAVRGVIVVETYENGPARKNGILVGDVITHINGQEIIAADDLARLVSNLKPGATAIVVLLRANTQLALAVGIELRPDPMPQPRTEQPPEKPKSRRFSGNQALQSDGSFLANIRERDIDVVASDLPQRFPAEFRALRAVMPGKLRSEDWIYSLNGTSGPMKRFTYDGRTHYYGKVCKPRDCAENWVRFIVEEGGGRAVGFISSPQLVGRSGTQIMSDFFGDITEDEYHLFVNSLSWD